MNAQSSRSGRCPINRHSSNVHARPAVMPEEFEKIPDKPLDRRALLKMGGVGTVVATLASTGVLWMPKRVAYAAPTILYPDIQFDIGDYVHPAQTMAGVPVDFGVVYTYLAPAVLTRNPTKADQTTLYNALHTIEANYAFSPSGIFTFVSYGIPYFNRLPSSLVASHMPLRNDGSKKPVLEEAVPGPTDFGPHNPGITKLQAKFRVPVKIEANDMLFTLRSDSLANITDVMNWLKGSNTLNGNAVPSPAFNGLLNFVTPRLNFVQPGLPRQMANTLSAQGVAPFTTIANEINPASSMWMGFVDQQINGSADEGQIVTFLGTSTARLTTAVLGDYFDSAAIQHLSHNLDDLEQFYAKEGAPKFPDGPEPYHERIQYIFHSQKADGSHALPFPEDPTDPFTNGGGLGAPTGNLTTQQQSSVLSNFTLGPNSIFQNFDPALLPHQKLRVGHTFALQRSSRAADGTPLHIRNDGPGLNSIDVPDGSTVPTLEFTIFVPTAEFFRVMRINAASLDLVKAGENGGTATSVPPGVEAADSGDDGLERFITATRRQNFLIPPRRHRSFPLLEFT